MTTTRGRKLIVSITDWLKLIVGVVDRLREEVYACVYFSISYYNTEEGNLCLILL